MKRGIGWLTLVFLVLAGCAGSAAKTVAPSSSAPAVTAVDEGATNVGSVRGTITDDEAQPIAGVRVAFLELEAEVATDAQGAFQFKAVPEGSHAIAAERLGYESVVKRVEIRVGEETKMDFMLKQLVVESEPYFQSIQKNTLHHVGETYVTFGINLTGQSPMCDGCVFTLHPLPVPSILLWEIFGEHTVQSPQGDKEHFWVFGNGPNGGGGTLLREFERLLPANLTLEETQLKTLDKKKPLLWFQLLCENFWFCLEEKRESWVTQFHLTDEIPEGFSARPKA